MTYREMAENASSVVNALSGEAYVIAPAKHAEELRDTAPALARVLGRSDVSAAAHDFERKDEDANRARDAFKTTAKRANVSILVASLFSTLLVLLGAFFPT